MHRGPRDLQAGLLDAHVQLVVFLHGGDDTVRVQWRRTRPQPQNDVARPLSILKCLDCMSMMPPMNSAKWYLRASAGANMVGSCDMGCRSGEARCMMCAGNVYDSMSFSGSRSTSCMAM